MNRDLVWIDRLYRIGKFLRLPRKLAVLLVNLGQAVRYAQKGVYLGPLVVLAIALLAGCHHTARFNWNNSCSEVKECPVDKFCAIDTGPDGEPYQYGQCINLDD
jgi:hypothetical protein